MNVLVYLVPIALIMGVLGLGAFLWSLKSGQYDDLEGAAQRILIDDEFVPEDETDEQTDPGPDDTNARGSA